MSKLPSEAKPNCRFPDPMFAASKWNDARPFTMAVSQVMKLVYRGHEIEGHTNKNVWAKVSCRFCSEVNYDRINNHQFKSSTIKI